MRDAIYCKGSLLAAVQNSRLFADCKHFVDMPLRHDAETILKNWEIIVGTTVDKDGKIPIDVLRAFVDEHFEAPGGELEDCHPTDYNNEHQFESITDVSYRAWAKDLHSKWPTLCRRVADKVHAAPERFSLLGVPHPLIVPGGRFREMYYWDTFFTIKGLIASNMFGTVRGLIENMGVLIDAYGFVPNGNRVYYLSRSQPPLLAWCLHAYFAATQDVEFLRRAMSWLEREQEFFVQKKQIQAAGWQHYLFRFHVVADGPRPESYREDLESAEHIAEEAGKKSLYGEIAAAAESGRDFSARWFGVDGPFAGKMGSTRTSTLIPVELNAIICCNLRYFAEFYEVLGDSQAAEKYCVQYQVMREAIHQVFWNEEQGCWFDYDLVLGRQITIYHDTILFPLYCGCVHDGFDGARVVSYLSTAGVLACPGGIPTSMISSGQQWDFPSGWAPTNWIIIQGLRASGQHETARVLAEKWIRKNYMIWLKSGGRMFEKYNVSTECSNAMGGGGEYEVQEGFGWTNGVVLDLLNTYASDLVFSNEQSTASCECCRRRTSLAVDVAPVDASHAATAVPTIVEQLANALIEASPIDVPAAAPLPAVVAAI